MPIRLDGSCRCGAVRFTVDSHTPQPYQLCYCSICRKTAGGGGYAINLMGVAGTLEVTGARAGRSTTPRSRSRTTTASAGSDQPGQRNFCSRCASALWLFDPRWPELVHPFASAIDSDAAGPARRACT